MNKKNLFMLVIVLLSCVQATAQEVLLPFGQISQQPWSARYFYAPNSGDKPADNWFAKDFNDSEWGLLNGPISSSNGLSYKETIWSKTYTSYWVRRHFTVSSLRNFIYLYTMHDDECIVYLNGIEIYHSTDYHVVPNYSTILLTEEQKALLHTGDNVIAVYVKDTGGQSFLDFGLYGYSGPIITNHSFENGTTGWTITGSDLRRLGQNTNYIMRSEGIYSFDAHQVIRGTMRGLYRLRAQAFQLQGEESNAWGLYNKVPVDTRLYMNGGETEVKNIFDDAESTNVYSSGSWITTGDNTFVPYNANMVSIAFTNGLYDNELYAYIDVDTLTIGVKKTNTDKKQWTCFDNFRLDYIDEQDMNTIKDSLNFYLTQPIFADYKTLLRTMSSELQSAANYLAKSQIIIKYSTKFAEIKKSINYYALLNESVSNLQNRLKSSTKASPSTCEEARQLITITSNAITNGTLTNKECKNKLSELEYMNKRLNYQYLDIAIYAPGSLGDSILNHAEYFDNVQSLRLSGTLNDADINVIKTRMASLCELDMESVNMESLPSKLLYQHKAIEKVVLPRTLKIIEERAFFECPQFTKVVFGSNLEEIGSNAFRRCPNLKELFLPTSLRTIGEEAFRGCHSLRELILPEGLTSIGSYAFSGCSSLTKLTLPSTLTTISNYCFASCLLSEINFSEGLISIGNCAFYPKTGTEKSVDDVSYRYYDNTLENLKFPSTLKIIGEDAFYGNRRLTNIQFNEGLYQINDDAFYHCDALEEVTLPSSLVLVNGTPFSYCNALKKVTSLAIEPAYIPKSLFYDVNMEGRELYVPALSINSYKQSTGWDLFPIILPIDHLPENINILGNLQLTLPETIPASYKPNVSMIYDKKGTSYYCYGSLTVNGSGVLSIANFSMIWDPYIQYEEYNRPQNYCTLLNNSHLRADDVSINTFIRNGKWTFISFPFDVRVSEIKTTGEGTTNWVVRKYDGQRRAAGETGSTWVRLTNDDVLQAGQGYILQGSRYVEGSSQYWSSFLTKAVNNGNKNKIFQTEDAIVTLKEYQSEYGHNRSWNLIGNPYPCYYDTRFMEYEAPITVWNINRNTYEAYSPIDDSYVLCPGEAFFLQCPVGEPNLVFGKEGRQTTREVRELDYASSRRIKTPASPRTLINIILSDANNSDRTRVVINENAILQYEQNKDAAKFFSTDIIIPQIYTKHRGVEYAINERPYENGTVELGIRISIDGLYSIALAEDIVDYKVFLEDKQLGSISELTASSPYMFEAKTGSAESRFILRFTKETSGISGLEKEQRVLESPVYTVEGIKYATPTRNGIYIQNGKKIMLNK